jgi:hypothetical protein
MKTLILMVCMIGLMAATFGGLFKLAEMSNDKQKVSQRK